MSNYATYCNEEKAAGRKPLSMTDWSKARKAEADPQPAPSGVENDPEDAAAETVTTGGGLKPGHGTVGTSAQGLAGLEEDAYDKVLEADNIVDPQEALDRVAFYRQKLAEAEVAASMMPQEDLRAKAEADAAASGVWVFHSQNRLGAIVLQSIQPTTVNGHFVPGRHQIADFSNHRWVTRDAELAKAMMDSEPYQKSEVILVPEGAMAPPAHVTVVDGPRTTATLHQRTREADRPRGPLSTTVR